MIHFLYIRSAGKSVDAPPKRNQPASPSQTANHSEQTVVDLDTSGERDMAEESPGGVESGQDNNWEVGEPENASSSEG